MLCVSTLATLEVLIRSMVEDEKAQAACPLKSAVIQAVAALLLLRTLKPSNCSADNAVSCVFYRSIFRREIVFALEGQTRIGNA